MKLPLRTRRYRCATLLRSQPSAWMIYSVWFATGDYASSESTEKSISTWRSCKPCASREAALADHFRRSRDGSWFPDPVEIPLDSVLGMIKRLEGVVVELERLGEPHLAFAEHSEVREATSVDIPELDSPQITSIATRVEHLRRHGAT